MSNETSLTLARALVIALEQDNEQEVSQILSQLAIEKESQLFSEVGRLTRQLHDALTGFTLDSKITSMTENDIPDAKERLHYVISMTEQAANQTLNVVEGLMPVSKDLDEQVNGLSEKWERFLDREMPFEEFKDMSQKISNHFQGSKASLTQLQSGLNDILLAQGFQDITGQVIRRVIDLVEDLELSLVELIKISGGIKAAEKTRDEPELPGPVVPGVDDKKNDVVNNQDDVDDLLSSLGF